MSSSPATTVPQGGPFTGTARSSDDSLSTAFAHLTAAALQPAAEDGADKAATRETVASGISQRAARRSVPLQRTQSLWSILDLDGTPAHVHAEGEGDDGDEGGGVMEWSGADATMAGASDQAESGEDGVSKSCRRKRSGDVRGGRLESSSTAGARQLRPRGDRSEEGATRRKSARKPKADARAAPYPRPSGDRQARRTVDRPRVHWASDVEDSCERRGLYLRQQLPRSVPIERGRTMFRSYETPHPPAHTDRSGSPSSTDTDTSTVCGSETSTVCGSETS